MVHIASTTGRTAATSIRRRIERTTDDATIDAGSTVRRWR